MSITADAVIIGGGITGTSIALNLIDQGVDNVLLLEKRFLGAGSSGKSGAILREHYSHETTIGMARYSLDFFSSFKERFGRDIGFNRPGMVFLTPAAEREALERNVSLQRGFGVQTEILDSRALRELEPRGSFEDDLMAAWEPEAGYVNPVRTVYAFAEIARENGVEIRAGEVATRIVTRAGKAVGVQTESGNFIETSTVVNAAGPWAGRLLQEIGLDYPLKAIRPEQAFFEPPGDFGGRTAIYADLRTGIYWKPEEAGWTRIGKLSYQGDGDVPDPDDYDEGVSQQFIAFSRSAICRRIPAFQRAVSWGGCGALYTITPDAHPLIGAVPEIEGLFLVSGFSGHGFKMGPAVGLGVAGMITGGDKGHFDPEFFDVSRMRKGKPVTVPYEYGVLG